jgi:hypothetical protein
MTDARVRIAGVRNWLAFRLAVGVLAMACGGQPGPAQTVVAGGQPVIRHEEPGTRPPSSLGFTHLTTKDGLSHNAVVDIVQGRRGFMWFATGEGLSRYDGHAFVAYKHHPNDPTSISDNSIRDLMEDDQGYLWVAAYPGVNKFDPRTERTTRYVHDPKDANSRHAGARRSDRREAGRLERDRLGNRGGAAHSSEQGLRDLRQAALVVAAVRIEHAGTTPRRSLLTARSCESGSLAGGGQVT